MIVRLRNLSARPPQQSDLKGVVELMATCDVAESLRQEDLEEEIRSVWQSNRFSLQSDAWIIVNNKGQVVGYADVREQHEGQYATSIYVHPAYRGRGIGTLLLWLVEERARQLMHALCPELRVTLSISVNSANQDSKHLLEREGYALARSFWRLVLNMQAIMPNGSSSEQGKLRVDMVFDAHNALDVVELNQRNGVSLARQYAIYEKELRPGIDAASLDGLPCEETLIK